MLIELLFGVAIGLGHYFSELICFVCTPWRNQLVSVSAGVATSYIFIDLFPQFVQGVGGNTYMFLSVLIGFSAFHVVEKYLYLHVNAHQGRHLERELRIEESVVDFIYHLGVGIIIVEFLRQGFLKGFLFVIPSFLYTALGTVSIKTAKSQIIKMIDASGALLGVILALLFFPITETYTVTFVILGLIIGVLIYNITRHSIPFGKEGLPGWFVSGAALYSWIILVTV